MTDAARSSVGLQARRGWPPILTIVLLVGILAVGGALRLYNVNWDRYQHVHPDERFIVWVADTVHWPGNLASALDPLTSPLNPFRWPPAPGEQVGQPRNYAYGHFPLYLLVAVAHGVQSAAAAAGRAGLAPGPDLLHAAEYQYLADVGRVISAVCDLGTLCLVYVLARGLQASRERPGPLPWGTGSGEQGAEMEPFPRSPSPAPSRSATELAGLLAAAAYGLAVLPTQLSHFYAVDMVLTFCVTASVALAVRAAEKGGLASWLAAGAMAGLAVGSKFSAILLAVPLAVAALYRLPEAERGRPRRVFARRLAAAGLAAALVFAVTNPFALLQPVAYIQQLASQNAMVNGLMDAPFTRQYAGSAPYWYFVQQLAQWGLGWPLGILAWGGLVWAAWQVARRRASPGLTVALAWALPYFAATGAFYAKFLRYMAPLLPFLLVFAAGASIAGYRWLAARWGRRGKAVAWAGLAVVAVFTLGWALAFNGVYRQPHPWIQASDWIYTHVPAGSKLLTEQWDDALPLAMDELPDRPAKRAYVQVELPLYDPDSQAKLDGLVSQLSSADYIVLSSNRLWAPIQRLPRRYPMSSQYYRLLAQGGLGYRLVAEFTDYPHLGSLVVPDDHADESFSVYDHPHVRVFANTGRLSPALLRARLGRYLPLGTARSGMGAPEVDDAAGYIDHTDARPVRPAGLAHAQGTSSVAASVILSGHASQPAPRRAAGDEVPAHAGPRAAGGESVLVSPKGLPVSALAPGSAAGSRGQAGRYVGAATTVFCLYAGMRAQTMAPAGDSPAASPGPQMLAGPVDSLPVVADFRWDQLASGSPVLAALFWWLVISLFGWLAWPLLFPLLAGLRERGYGLARLIGWLIIGWLHWLAVSLGLWQNRAGPLAALLACLALAGLLAAWAQRKELADFWREQHVLLLVAEGVFAAAFVAFVVIRLLDPDLWQPWDGGEKFMDFAFLNAILRSAHFPPYDPYFAGGTINYYYYGLYLVSLPVKLTGIVPEVAYNLAVPGLFALAAMALFSLGADLAGARRAGRESPEEGGAQPTAQDGRDEGPAQDSRGHAGSPGAAVGAGLLAVLLALLMGNLASFAQVAGNLATLGGSSGASPLAMLRGALVLLHGLQAWPGFDYWAASRVIPYTINEFPFWSFLFADLHPHLIAMPVGLAVIGLSLNWLMLPGRSSWPGMAARLLLFVVALGALGPTNTWDLPVYLLLVAAAFVLVPWRSRRWMPGLGAICLGVATGGMAVLAYWPFYQHYQAQVGQAGRSLLARYLAPVSASSPVGAWLSIWAFFVFLAISYVFVLLRSARPRPGVLPTGRMLEEPKEPDPVPEPEGGAGEGSAAPDLRPDSERGAAGQAMSPDPCPWHGASPPAPAGDLQPLASASPSPASLSTPPGVPVVVAAILVLLGLALTLVMLNRLTAALVVVPLGLALLLLIGGRTSLQDAFALLLVVLGLGILGGIELIYLRDFLDGGDWSRMNTVFKFGMPAWLLLGLASSVMLPRVWRAASRWAMLWRLPAAAVLVAGLFFLPFGITARVADRFPNARPGFGTLDGTAYMTVGQYEWPDEKHTILLSYDDQAVHWLLDHVNGTPVVAEAPDGDYSVDGTLVGYDYYRAGGLRVASLTGLPTFVGQHQDEQRPGDQVAERTALGQEFFETTEVGRTRELIATLHVDYIYVGALEKLLFAPASLAKFSGMAQSGQLDIVYENPGVTIYKVNR